MEFVRFLGGGCKGAAVSSQNTRSSSKGTLGFESLRLPLVFHLIAGLLMFDWMEDMGLVYTVVQHMQSMNGETEGHGVAWLLIKVNTDLNGRVCVALVATAINIDHNNAKIPSSG